MLAGDAQGNGSKSTVGQSLVRLGGWMLGELKRRWFVVAVSVSVPICLLAARDVYAVLRHWPPRGNVAVAMFLVSLGIPLQHLFRAVLRPQAVFLALAVNYGVLPLASWGVAYAMAWLGYVEYAAGLMICASVPCTLASAAVWTRMAGGDEATAVAVTIASTSTAWLVTSGWVALSLGSNVRVAMLPMMADLLVVLVGPMTVAQLLRLSVRVRAWVVRHRTLLGVLAQLSILVIILHGVALAGVRLGENSWREQIGPILLSAGMAPGLHLLALWFAWQAGGLVGLERPQRIAAAIAGSQKTLPVSLQIATTYFPGYPLAVIPVLFFHIGQLLLDTWLADWWRRSADSADPAACKMPCPRQNDHE
jgi:sodium/bile acid cotransporter 7